MSDDNSKPGKSNAQQRLNQVSQHLQSSPSSPSTSSLSSSSSSKSPAENAAESNTSRPRRRDRKSSNSSQPADWSDVLGQLKELQEIARTPPTSSPGYVRQKKAGKLWVRERLDQLLDAGSSFAEVGSVTGTIAWRQEPLSPSSSSSSSSPSSSSSIQSFRPSNNVQGLGLIGGRKVALTADDYSIRAGHADGATGAKTAFLEQLALELRIPVVKLVDGSSGGGSVTTLRADGFSYVPPMPGFRDVARQLDLGIPNVAAILGPAIGLGAARATACHFSVMAADVGALFNAGPRVVAHATFEEDLTPADLGGPDVHCANGTIDNAAPDEKACFAQIRAFLSYVPDCGHSRLPPVIAAEDPVDRDVSALRTVIPRRRARAYAMGRVIETTVDAGSFFEIGAGWGGTAIVGLARLGGRPVGIVANNPEVQAGATDAGGAQKMTRHLNLCDCFNLPVVQLVDCPGYAVGTAAERNATMKWGVELGKALFQTTVPIFSVVVRKCYGVAGGLHVDCREPQMRVGWPSMESGSLPLEGGVEASHSRELKEAGEGREKLLQELMADYKRLQNPVRTAAAFSIQEIIDPADTRKLLCAWTARMYENRLPERIADRQSGKIRPVFR